VNHNIPVIIVITATLLLSPTASAGEIKIAVASNFADTMTALVSSFETATSHTVIPVFGSTGKHYAQIVNGAPFAIFLAADVRRPELLEEKGLALPGSRFTYAVGRLVLWSRMEDFVDPEGVILTKDRFRHLAIANPKLAPYGEAAHEVLMALGLQKKLDQYLVSGENISQTFQFVQTGNAELGFVALSQVIRPGEKERGSSWLVPPNLHHPIEQQAVLLVDSKPARAFLEFLTGSTAQEIIRHHGYTVP